MGVGLLSAFLKIFFSLGHHHRAAFLFDLQKKKSISGDFAVLTNCQVRPYENLSIVDL